MRGDFGYRWLSLNRVEIENSSVHVHLAVLDYGASMLDYVGGNTYASLKEEHDALPHHERRSHNLLPFAWHAKGRDSSTDLPPHELCFRPYHAVLLAKMPGRDDCYQRRSPGLFRVQRPPGGWRTPTTVYIVSEPSRSPSI